MTGKKILVVEDEPDLAQLLAYNLERDGFEVTVAASGEDGLAQVSRVKPDLILLDLMLPGINGLDVCRSLKASADTRDIPVIMLTARDEEIDVVSGLELGADDYVTKPFSAKILTARIRTVLRRKTAPVETGGDEINTGDIRIDNVRHRAYARGEPVELTPTEYMLLVALAERPGWLFSRNQLIDRLRDGHHVITDRAIDVQVANLRKKLGPSGDHIETVRGFGYRMKENL